MHRSACSCVARCGGCGGSQGMVSPWRCTRQHSRAFALAGPQRFRLRLKSLNAQRQLVPQAPDRLRRALGARSGFALPGELGGERLLRSVRFA